MFYTLYKRRAIKIQQALLLLLHLLPTRTVHVGTCGLLLEVGTYSQVVRSTNPSA